MPETTTTTILMHEAHCDALVADVVDWSVGRLVSRSIGRSIGNTDVLWWIKLPHNAGLDLSQCHFVLDVLETPQTGKL